MNDTPKIESVAPRKLVRFVDLKARGIVRSWPTLLSWIKREGFPPGFMLAPQTRAWDEAEIDRWIEARRSRSRPRRNCGNAKAKRKSKSTATPSRKSAGTIPAKVRERYPAKVREKPSYKKPPYRNLKHEVAPKGAGNVSEKERNNSRAKQPTPHQAENPIEEDELDYFPICARGRR